MAGEEQIITLYILTEDHSIDLTARAVTGYTIDPIIAESMLEDSFFGEMKEVKITRRQWEDVQKIVLKEE